jgi:hypothetical protein
MELLLSLLLSLLSLLLSLLTLADVSPTSGHWTAK